MANIVDIMGGAFKVERDIAAQPVEIQIIDAITSHGLEAPDSIEIDGNIHRFNSNGKRGDDAGWYVFYGDGIVAGSFGCWRDGVSGNFRQDIGRELSPIEQLETKRKMAKAREMREAAQKKKHEVAALTVDAVWSNAGFASSDHPYLVKKAVQSHNIKITGDGRLIIPIYIDNKLTSLQFIDNDGGKKFQSGGEVKSGYYKIGNDDSTIYIAEGYATAATIHEQTEKSVYIAFNAGNMVNVADFVRSKYGNQANIVIVADHDESETGQKAGRDAASKIGARLVVPPVVGDANDYWLAGGDLISLLEPKSTGWLIQADEFSSQPSPIKWLIKGVMQQESLIMIHGPSGVGKTFVIMDMALSIAAGMPDWFGRKVNPGGVVYLAGEGHHGLRGRVAAWKQHNNIDKVNAWVSSAGCDLNTAEGYRLAVDSISSLPEPPAMIVVDTLHRFLNGDENSAQDAKTMIDACNEISRLFRCAVVLIHHTGVSSEAQHRARGSSAWKGALDIELSVLPSDEHIKIEMRKSKDSEMIEPLFASLQSVNIHNWFDDDGEPVGSAVLIEEDKPAQRYDSKISKYIKTLHRAWIDSGAEIEDNQPYISSSALRNFLITEYECSEGTAKNHTMPSYQNGLVRTLIDGEVIVKKSHGFTVIAAEIASAWMLSLSEKINEF